MLKGFNLSPVSLNSSDYLEKQPLHSKLFKMIMLHDTTCCKDLLGGDF